MNYEFAIMPNGRRQIVTRTDTHFISTVEHNTGSNTDFINAVDGLTGHSTQRFETMVLRRLTPWRSDDGQINWIEIDERQTNLEDQAILNHGELVTYYAT